MNTRTTVLAALSVCLLCLAALSGCSGAEASAAGTYELDKEAIKTAMQAELEKEAENSEDGMAQFGSAMMLGMIDSMSMTMTLNEDGTATMVMKMMGDSQTMNGTWMLDGKSITITAAEEGKEPEPASGTFDGDTITLKPPADEEMPFDLVFRKKA